MTDSDVDERVERVMDPLIGTIHHDEWDRTTCEYMFRMFARELIEELERGDTDE